VSLKVRVDDSMNPHGPNGFFDWTLDPVAAQCKRCLRSYAMWISAKQRDQDQYAAIQNSASN
jgi:hypothetical protein